jgi:hypothetical protein
MRIFGQKKDSGNLALTLSIIIAAGSMITLKTMADRSISLLKSSQRSENMDRAREVPRSATALAQSLITLPINVLEKKATMWTTPEIIKNKSYMPVLYPVPYLTGTNFGPADSANKLIVASPLKSYTDLNYDASDMTLLDKSTVKLFVNDASRSNEDQVSATYRTPANLTRGKAVVSRTTSLAEFNFRSCSRDVNGNLVDSPTFTGLYCVSALITSDSYATEKKGGAKTVTGQNKGLAQLGALEPPPVPSCTKILTDLDNQNIKIAGNQTLNVNVTASGVVTGYRVLLRQRPSRSVTSILPLGFGGPISNPLREKILFDSGTTPIATPWNSPIGSDISSNLPSVSFDTMALADQDNFEVYKPVQIVIALKGADQSEMQCAPQVFRLTPVDCQASINRVSAADKRCVFTVANVGTAPPILVRVERRGCSASKPTTIPIPSRRPIRQWTASGGGFATVLPVADCPDDGVRSEFTAWSNDGGPTRACGAGIKGSQPWTVGGGDQHALFSTVQGCAGIPGSGSLNYSNATMDGVRLALGYDSYSGANNVGTESRTNYTTCGDNTHTFWSGSAWGVMAACGAEWLTNLNLSFRAPYNFTPTNFAPPTPIRQGVTIPPPR